MGVYEYQIRHLPAFPRFGQRGDSYFYLTKTQGSELDDSVALLKIDRSMKAWSEVHFHCPEREDVEQVTTKASSMIKIFGHT